MVFEKGKVYKFDEEKFKKSMKMTDEEFQATCDQWASEIADIEFEVDRNYNEEENYELKTSNSVLDYTLRPDWCSEVKKESIVEGEK